MTDQSVQQVNIEHEMRDAYLSYAMSVIVSRALPDARDGLKPVHRRILYAMHDMGIAPNSVHKKSARIVGEVLGKYHPHGDAAVYETMVRMARDFSMRYMLIDGQGNFGTIDGDGAAAMRYTEARMADIGSELLVDIGKDTVDFVENFDGTLNEPAVLPAQMPNLLVNGASGIAVGMSTNIPPHNLGEICDALSYMLDEWERYDDITVDDLMRFVKGPDFPTGGLIYRMRGDEDTLRGAFATGRGKLTARAKVHIEDMGRGKSRIIVSELPFQVNKTTLIERIAALVSSGKLEGLADLRDESDRQNSVRLVIELQRGADVRQTLAALFKLTPLQSTFGIIMLALVDGQPRTINLKTALRVYLDHRLEVVQRRSRFDLGRAQERAHVLEGLIVALDQLDAVIQTIRRSRTTDTARRNLMRDFKVTEAQARAILEMPLRRLASLEMRRIRDEYQQTIRQIQALQALLASPASQRAVIADDLQTLTKRYGDRRRSIIVDAEAGFDAVEDFLMPDEPTWVVFGLNDRLCRANLRRRPRSFKAAIRSPRFLHESATSQIVYLFTASGLCATLPALQLPETSDVTEGAPFSEMTALAADERVIALHCLPARVEGGYLFLVTERGQVKRLPAAELPGVASHSFSVMKVAADDRLAAVLVTTGADEALLSTAGGYAIRFREDEVRATGLTARGMRGMRLALDADRVVAASLVVQDGLVWSITDDGVAKASPIDQYPLRLRGGAGVMSMRLAPDSRAVVAAATGRTNDGLLLLTSKNRARYTRLNEAEIAKRGAKKAGVSVIDLGENESVVAVATYQTRIETRPSAAAVADSGDDETRPASASVDSSDNGATQGAASGDGS